MGKKEKILLESGKSKLPYVGGIITLFGGSVAVLILQNSLIAHHRCSHAVSVMSSMISWLVSGVLLVAAFILSQSGSGFYVLTKERIYYRDRKGQEKWEVKLCDVENCQIRAPLLARLCGCYRLVLSLKGHERGGVLVTLGPFPANISRVWQQEVTKIFSGRG